MIYCKKCGTPAEEAAQFCGSCGGSFGGHETKTVVFSASSSELTAQNLPETSMQEPEPPSTSLIGFPLFRQIFFWVVVIVTIVVVAHSCSDYDNAPERTLEGYCNALKGKVNIDSAYSYLSSRETGKSTLSKEQLAAQVNALTSGKVDGVGDCSINIANTYGNIAHGTIRYTYGNGSQATRSYELFKGDQPGEQSWMIETKDWTPENAPAA